MTKGHAACLHQIHIVCEAEDSCPQVLEGHQPVDEAAAARLFAAMARLADSGQDSTPAADLAASMANLAVDYPPEVHPCFLPAP